MEVIVQDCDVSGEVAHSDPLLEHVSILHIDADPQHEPMVFCDEVSQARTKVLGQALKNSARMAMFSLLV